MIKHIQASVRSEPPTFNHFVVKEFATEVIFHCWNRYFRNFWIIFSMVSLHYTWLLKQDMTVCLILISEL